MFYLYILSAILIAVVVLTVLVLFYSFIKTGGATRYDTHFYELDKQGQPGEVVQRKYRNLSHLLYRLLDTCRYSYPVFLVYVFRSISSKFREKIMITTALSNTCAH